MYTIDTEWDPDGKFLCGSYYGAPAGCKPVMTFIEKGVPYNGPTYIDDVAYYFVAPRDIGLMERFVKFREYRDLSVLIKIHNNISTFDDAAYGFGLKDLVAEYCRTPKGKPVLMKYKQVDFTAMKVSPRLRKHNKEDSKCTWLLADYFLKIVTPEELRVAARMEERNKSWRAIAMQCIHYDVEWQASLIEPANMHKRLEAKGIDFFILIDGKLHIKRKKFQDWLHLHKIAVPSAVSKVKYAKDGLLLQMHYGEFAELGRSAREPEVREWCSLIHLALRSHVAQTGDVRFAKNIIHPTEICCAQSSGRVTHIGCPITAGILFRMAVVPPPGMKILSLDIKSQEVVLAALFSEDKALQEACLRDVYSALAAGFNSTEYVKLDKKDPYRTFVKNIVLPWLYGVGDKKLAERMHCEVAYTHMLLDRLDRMFPDFYWWKQEVLAATVTEGIAITAIDKYPLQIVGDDFNPKQVVNHCIQGTGCDMLRIWVDKLVEMGYPPIATLHDGCYVYVSLDFDENILIDASEQVLNERLPLWIKPDGERASWKVECSTYHGHLMEKGEDYCRLIASLRGGMCWKQVMMQEPKEDWFDAIREVYDKCQALNT